jgi:hypothetical protein
VPLASALSLNAFAFGELLFFEGLQRKVTKRKQPSPIRANPPSGSRRDFSKGRPVPWKNAARPVRRPPGLCVTPSSQISRNKAPSASDAGRYDALAFALARHAIPAIGCLRKTPKGRRPWMGAVFSRAMDGESENRSRIPTGDLAVSGKRHFFWLLFFGRYQRKVTRQRRKRLILTTKAKDTASLLSQG